MKRVISSIMIVTCLVSCSNNTHTINNDYQLNKKPLITVEQHNQSLKLFIKKSDSNKALLDTFEIPNDIPKLEYAFTHDIKGKPYIFIGISYHENYRDFEHPYINYINFYLTNVYKCDLKYNCVYDEKFSHFFGIGGDLIDSNSKQLLNNYPYKSESDIKYTLQTQYFKDWLNNKLVKGQTTKRTQLSDVPNYYAGETNFLSKDTHFNIIDASAGWLNISTMQVEGWIKCEDTNLCN